MESMKMTMKLFAITVVMMVAVSSVSAADPPTPAPMSAATTLFVPTAVTALSAFVFTLIF
ncbi:putative arabinogalactan protein/12/13/14/21 [Helianthus annuus]|nr:putative arabinogalactan protein/12/13/14/21 [Helianthus annuus]